MHLKGLIVLPCLLTSAFATTHNLTGSFSKFKAESMKSEERSVQDLYNSCNEMDQDGNLLSTGKVCVATLLWSTYQVLHAATQVQPVDVIHNGTVINEEASNEEIIPITTAAVTTGAAVAIAPNSSPLSVSPTTSSRQPSSPQTYKSKPNQQRDITDSLFLERINDKLLEQQYGDRLAVRALDTGESELHPSDGVAIRTNVHANDAFLHVHTNGSHATAEFKKETGSRMLRRDQDVSIAHSFQFSEKSFGIKMQINKIGRVNASMSDMHAYWNAFGYGNGEDGTDPAFNGSDSWKFVVCDKGWQVIAGKVVALEGPSDYVYEPNDEKIGCA